MLIKRIVSKHFTSKPAYLNTTSHIFLSRSLSLALVLLQLVLLAWLHLRDLPLTQVHLLPASASIRNLKHFTSAYTSFPFPASNHCDLFSLAGTPSSLPRSNTSCVDDLTLYLILYPISVSRASRTHRRPRQNKKHLSRKGQYLIRHNTVAHPTPSVHPRIED